MNELNTDMCKWNDLSLSAFSLLCHWEQGLETFKVLDLLAELRICVPATPFPADKTAERQSSLFSNFFW